MISDKDLALLKLLKSNARESTASLARQLGVSRSTLQERLQRLEREGIIAGYTVLLREEYQRGRIRAEVLLNVDAKRAESVIREMKTLPAVAELAAVSGAFDYLARVEGQSTEEIDRLLDRIGRIPGIERTQTLILLSEKFSR